MNDTVMYDIVLDRFEELSRHGYRFEKLLNKLENESDTYELYEDLYEEDIICL